MNKSSMSKISIIERLKTDKKLQLLLAILVSVLIIAFLVFGFSKNEEGNVSEDKVLSYVNDLEDRLIKTLSKVDGVGEVSVVITVDSGMETVLANKTTVSGTGDNVKTEESPIIVNGKTVVVKELYPKVCGVLIVADGANNISVMKKIQQATVSLLNINVGQIEILAMK